MAAMARSKLLFSPGLFIYGFTAHSNMRKAVEKENTTTGSKEFFHRNG
jgi:hypothetical protein